MFAGPRTCAVMASTVWPSTALPATATMTSLASSPAPAAGAPGTVRTTTSAQAEPRGVQPSVPSGARLVMTAPMPSNWPARPDRVEVRAAGARYSL